MRCGTWQEPWGDASLELRCLRNSFWSDKSCSWTPSSPTVPEGTTRANVLARSGSAWGAPDKVPGAWFQSYQEPQSFLLTNKFNKKSNRLNFPFLFLHLKSVDQLKLCLSNKRWLRSACFSNTFPVSLQTDELFRSSAEGLFFWGCWDADATFSAAYTRPDFSVKGQEDAFYCGGGAGSPTGSSDQQSVQFDRLKFEESFWQ